jgi:hypothetical protein
VLVLVLVLVMPGAARCCAGGSAVGLHARMWQHVVLGARQGPHQGCTLLQYSDDASMAHLMAHLSLASPPRHDASAPPSPATSSVSLRCACAPLQVWSHEAWSSDDFMGQAELALTELTGVVASRRAMSVVLPLYVVMKDGQREQGQFGEVKLNVWRASAVDARRLSMSETHCAGVLLVLPLCEMHVCA